MSHFDDQLRDHLRDLLGITAVLERLDGIDHKLDLIHRGQSGTRHDLRILMSDATDLTASVDALVAEDGEVKQALNDLVAKIQAAGDPALVAAAQDAVSRVNAAVADVHAAVQAADPSDPADPNAPTT